MSLARSLLPLTRWRTGWVVSALLALASCGDDAAGGVRVGPPPGNAACEAGQLTLPDGSCQPAGVPPDMPCPPGERALADGGCQPAGVPPEACAAPRFLPDGRGGCEAILPIDPCPPGAMAVPGDSACREVAPCGEGTWGDIPVEATTQYVDQGYSGNDSDGSRQKPWTTVQAGVSAATAGAIVAVAAGRYEEDVVIEDKAVRLQGRCPAQTVVAGLGAQAATITVLDAGASDAQVRGLAVTGPRTGVLVQGARRVVLEALWVHEALVLGVAAIRGAGVTLRDALVERNYQAGMYVLGSDMTVEAAVVRATRLDGDGSFGRGINVGSDPNTGERSKLSLTASLVEQNHDIGVAVFGSDTTVEATVVRATQPDGARANGRGISVESDPDTGERGKLSLTASLVEQNHAFGVTVFGADATIEATVVRGTEQDREEESGFGISVESDPTMTAQGKLSLTASLIEQNRGQGVIVSGAEATIEATLVRATQTTRAGKGGRGISVQTDSSTGKGGKLSLAASRVEENHEIGVFVGGSEATIEATVVRATQPDVTSGVGRGIAVVWDRSLRLGGKLSLTASLVEENHQAGVLVGASEAMISATTVRATQTDSSGRYGHGIVAVPDPNTGDGSKLSLTASLVEENYAAGVLVAASEATISSTAVRATKRAPAEVDFGDGILVSDDPAPSRAVIAATASTDNTRVGVLYSGSTGELSGVLSSGNRFGLVLQPGASGANPTLGESNVFESNTDQDRIAGGNLPVPDAALPLP